VAFKKGQSGNPNGRPTGAKNRNTLLADALASYGKQHNIDDVHGAILAGVIQQSLNGDLAASKLILDRLIPALKPIDKPINIEPSDPQTASEIVIKLFEGVLTGNVQITDFKQILEMMPKLKQAERSVSDGFFADGQHKYFASDKE